MKRILAIVLVASMVLGGISQAGWDDKLMDKLLQAGSDALEKEKQRRRKEVEQKETAPAPQDHERGWDDRGKEMLSVFLTNATNPSNAPLAIRTAHTLKGTFDVLLDEYKEQYKDEGRAYARELGDIIVERVREDPKIRSSIYSLQMLCWGVIGYLTLVTIIMLSCPQAHQCTFAQRDAGHTKTPPVTAGGAGKRCSLIEPSR